MKTKIIVASVAVLLIAATAAVLSQNRKQIREFLSGFEEVPVVSTEANGQFRARISNSQNNITYTLSYDDLEGAVTQAHIHLGQTDVNGAIIVWLCGNNPPTNPPPGTQVCPPSPATITGTIEADDITGQPAGPPAGQGIQPGEYDEFVSAMRAGKTYVNVHTVKFPGGEIRSQIDTRGGHHGDHDDDDDVRKEAPPAENQ